MTGAFSSWSDFLAMGGYALYVWLSVFFTLSPIALLAWQSSREHRRLLRALRATAKKEKR